MRKLLEKVGHMFNGYEDFIKRIKGYVWASDSPDEFKESWGKMLKEFNLTDNEWLHHKYEILELFVHVYLKEDLLGGILRTTSGSESQNSMFGSLTCPNLAWWNFGQDLWVPWSHNAILSAKLKMLL